MHKRILIISEYIAPDQEIGAIRWTKIAKYLKQQQDVKITVLTNQKNYDNDNTLLPKVQKDALLKRDMAAFDDYWVVPADGALRLYLRLKIKMVGSSKPREFGYKPPEARTMFGLLKQEAIGLANDYKGKIIARAVLRFLHEKTQDFDVIISTYGPAWTHLVAEQIKKKMPNAFWIADFRDPYAKETDGPIAFARHKRFGNKHCQRADMVTKVNEYLKTYTPKETPLTVISNGYDDADVLPSLPASKFSFVFTGTLYKERQDLGVIFRILNELIDQGQICPADISVEYAGPSGSVAEELAKKSSAEHYFINYGLIERSAALCLQQQAALLIYLIWNTEQEQSAWSGKMYEYMSTRKPIVAIVTGNKPHSYVSNYIHLLGGCCYEECRDDETYSELKSYILEKYSEWKKDGSISIKRNEAYVTQYSYTAIAQQVWNLVENKGRKE